MGREFSAGGVLVRRLRGQWVLAAIRPAGKPPGLWALPKGLIDEGEQAATTGAREVAEETGAEGRIEGKLGDVRYVSAQGGRRGEVAAGRRGAAAPRLQGRARHGRAGETRARFGHLTMIPAPGCTH
jgi:8-oxo-dGTP pyrophosphatase MutT (NUDIX family)